MKSRLTKGILVGIAIAAMSLLSNTATAEVEELKLGHQMGLGYLQFYIMREYKLVEKYAAAEGIKNLKVTYKSIGSPTILNDTILSGRLDMVSAGPPPFLNIWDKTKGNIDVRMLAALNMQPMKLNTNNPKWKHACDFSSTDRIAVPGVKTSTHAILLSMLAKKCLGPAKEGAFNDLEVPMTHPDAVIALTSGKSVITGHFSTIPYGDTELKDPNVHTVIDSYELMGGPSIVTGVWLSTKFYNENPKVTRAAFEAFSEATHFINSNHAKAAEIYLKYDKATPLNEQQVEKILNDPTVIYTMAPKKMMVWAQTMYSLKLLKHKPTTWKEFFFPLAYGLPGS